MPTEQDVRLKLQQVKYPGFSRDIVSFGLIKQIALNGGAVSVTLEITSQNREIAQQIKSEAEQALRQIPELTHIFVDVRLPNTGAPQTTGPSPFANQNRVGGIKHIVAVASGKGGVGKSTCSVNLACAFRHMGLKVGLLDCDIYGPSIPLMMGIKQKPGITDDEKLLPPENHGVKLMSMGFIIEGDTPVIWRGPMIVKTIQQFLLQVQWGELDILLVDLPPGTGDAQLTLCQTVPLDGGVIVTTPQEASLGVVRKGIAMFQKVNVPILGIVENMSYFQTPGGERVEIFGHGGGRDEAARQNVPFLGEVPLITDIRIGGDKGIPAMISDPHGEAAGRFLAIASSLQGELK
jgi:ATP-binding protein involved in chromosome partitioning